MCELPHRLPLSSYSGLCLAPFTWESSAYHRCHPHVLVAILRGLSREGLGGRRAEGLAKAPREFEAPYFWEFNLLAHCLTLVGPAPSSSPADGENVADPSAAQVLR